MAQVAKVKQLLQKQQDDEWIVEPVEDDEWVVEAAGPDPNDAIRQQQAAKFPTSAEQGGKPGQAQQAGLGWRIADAVFDTTGNDPNVQPMGHPVMEHALGSVTTSSPLQLWQGAKNIPQMVKQSPAGQIVKAGTGAADDLLSRVKRAASTPKGMERSLAPTSKAMKGEAQAIAPKLAQQGDFALTQKRFDANVVQKAENAGAAVRAAEDSIPATTMIPRQPILQRLETAIEELQIPGQGDEMISGHPDAIKSLTNLYNDIAKLPEQVPFKDLIKYRRQLDAAIDQVRGFSETASAADKAAMLARKKAVGIIREQLNGVSPELAQANKEFSLYRRAADIIEDRQLGQVGKPGIIGRGVKTAKRGAMMGLGGYGAWEILGSK